MSKAWNILLYLLLVVFIINVLVVAPRKVCSTPAAQTYPRQWFCDVDSDKMTAADVFKYQAGYEKAAGAFFLQGAGQSFANYCIPRDEKQHRATAWDSLILFEADTSPPLF